jgi:hypothetical protein
VGIKKENLVGSIASLGSALVAVVVLKSKDNGRMAQEGFLFELVATVMFVYAGVKGPRWWLAGPVVVILFWIGVAHIPSLWN